MTCWYGGTATRPAIPGIAIGAKKSPPAPVHVQFRTLFCFWNKTHISRTEGFRFHLKLQHFSRVLSDFNAPKHYSNLPRRNANRPLYFLPDWDDFLDVDFNFICDKFSAEDRCDRDEAHSIELIRPKRLCDGILLSLAQHLGGGKGLLRRVSPSDPGLLKAAIDVTQVFDP